jgi:hypothetical protein
MPSYSAGSGAPAFVDAGLYQFKVIEATEKTARTGSEMVELVLEVAGGTRVFDNLVFHPKSLWKIDQFRVSIGEEVEEGEFDFEPSDYVGAAGTVQLKLGESNSGKTRNEVLQYLAPSVKTFAVPGPVQKMDAPKAKVGTVTKAADLVPDDSDIPF